MFGVTHLRRIERPIAVVVVRDGMAASEDELRSRLGARIAKWWIPDRVANVRSASVTQIFLSSGAGVVAQIPPE